MKRAWSAPVVLFVVGCSGSSSPPVEAAVVPATLQSPVSDDAKACILGAVGKWKLSRNVGAGSAMVLLSFAE